MLPPPAWTSSVNVDLLSLISIRDSGSQAAGVCGGGEALLSWGTLYVLMTNAMGSRGAPSGCMGIHVLLQELFDKLRPGTLSTDKYKKPADYGLKPEKGKSWRDFLYQQHESKRNTHPWINTRGEIFGRFRTGGLMRKILLHITHPCDGRLKHL